MRFCFGRTTLKKESASYVETVVLLVDWLPSAMVEPVSVWPLSLPGSCMVVSEGSPLNRWVFYMSVFTKRWRFIGGSAVPCLWRQQRGHLDMIVTNNADGGLQYRSTRSRMRWNFTSVLNVNIIFRKFPYLYVMYQLIWLEFDRLFIERYLM